MDKLRNYTGFLWWIPFLLVFCTVFATGNALDNGVVSGKYFWFYGSMAPVALVCAILPWYPACSFRFRWGDWAVVSFALLVYASAFLFNQAPLNRNKLMIFTLLLALYFAFRLVLSARIRYTEQVFCFIFVLTGLGQAVAGLLQLYGFTVSNHSLFRITGSFYNPGPYAGYLSVIFPMALSLGLTIRGKDIVSRFLQIGGWITVVAILLVLPAAMSRASWIAAVSGSLVVVFIFLSGKYHFGEYLHKYKKTIIFALSALLILCCFLSAGMYYLKKDSADGRFLMWKVSAGAVGKHPLGVGLGNFSGAYGDAQADYLSGEQASETERTVAGSPEYAFNEYLQIAVESGIAATLLFVSILLLNIRYALQKKKTGILGSLTAISVFSLFSYPFSVLPFLIVLFFLLATCTTGETQEKKSSRKISSGISAVIVLLTVYCLADRVPTYNSYKKWNEVKVYYNVGMYREASAHYSAIYPGLCDQVTFLFEYAQSLSKSGRYQESNEIVQHALHMSCDPMFYNIMGRNEQALKAYDRAEAAYIRAARIVPNRLYPHYLLAKLYEETGQTVKALQEAEIVQTKEPRVESMAIEEMRQEMEKIIQPKSTF